MEFPSFLMHYFRTTTCSVFHFEKKKKVHMFSDLNLFNIGIDVLHLDMW